MVANIRKKFNEEFTAEKYLAYSKELNQEFPKDLVFRIAETPIFLDKAFTNKVIDTCEYIVDVITQYNFKSLTSHAIPKEFRIPNENEYPQFIAFDFGICQNQEGILEPQLIEMQGFPSLFAFQVFQDEAIRNHFDIPNNYSSYLNGYTKETYLQLLKEIVVGNTNPENVILLDIFPEEQKTRIDFRYTEKYIGVAAVCLTDLILEGRKLFYQKGEQKIPIHKIYNRLILDDLEHQSPEIKEKGKILLEDLDVEWLPHPNWFYRISKYTLPFLKHPYIPPTSFLNELKSIPADLENYVLKPLFSFAGQGVVIDVQLSDIQSIKDPENWILQRKVQYAEAIETPDTPSKAEIRIFYFWEKGKLRPVAVGNLARMAKGKMIGVRYNKDKEWVGGTIVYFEQ